MSFISTNMQALPPHLRQLFEQAGQQPGGTGSAVGGYGTGVGATVGSMPPTGQYIGPLGGSPWPFNQDIGGVGVPAKPGNIGAAPEQAPGEAMPSMPMTPQRVRPISQTRLMAMRRGQRPSHNASQYLPRDYVKRQLQMAGMMPAMQQGLYG